MKKFFGILAIAIAMVCFVQSANAQTTASANFNLSMTVDKYIETTPNPIIYFAGVTDGWHNPGRQSLAVYSPKWNLAYANCGFSVTVSGSNAAGQDKPRFVRQESGDHAGGFDILPTQYVVALTTNGERTCVTPGWENRQAAELFPFTKSYLEAPHNGQVAMDLMVYVNCNAESTVPLRLNSINSNFTHEQSADAGDYTCNMVVTLTAI